MKLAITCTALLALVIPVFAAQSAERHVTGGVIRGADLPDGSAIFKGIPYAAPPVEDLRWKPPQPVISWHGIREARVAGNPCMQTDEGWNANDAAIGSEDCLTLSVHEPKHRQNERLPVYVWIHGGSNRAGSGGDTADSPIYKHGIVVVSIDYRLGIFGFLASPELRDESPHHSSGNYGLLDQIAALQWVSNNIAAFGGDANNVTVGGQSAGAMDIGQLLRSPLAVGLFKRVIQESGVIGPPRSAADNEHIGRDLLNALEIPSGVSALSALRRLPASVLLVTSDKLAPVTGDHNLLWMESSADGWVIPVVRNNLYQNDDVSHVAHLVGNVTQEFIFDGTSEEAHALVNRIYGPVAQAALNLYGFRKTEPPTDDAIFGSVGTQALTDWTMRCPSYQLAKWTMTTQQGKHHRVWRYEFGIARPGRPRVEHNAELDYAYQAMPTGATSQAWPPLQQYWANFIKYGNPNGQALPYWPDMGASANYIAFLPTGIQRGKDMHGNLCRLLAEKNASH